jgi:MYXO-CTERM domain-containing protein
MDMHPERSNLGSRTEPRAIRRAIRRASGRWFGLALTSLTLFCMPSAQAHFTLLKPKSWLNEDETGGPQKGSPCGPGNTHGLLGDDVQPIPVSDHVTTLRAGETIPIQLAETIYHPGYFRVSIARKRAADATAKDFPDPPLMDEEQCTYDKSAVRTGAHGNVLADGLFVAEGLEGENRKLMHSVKLPNEPCEECSLQIMQVMEDHGASLCFYYHCADIKILPAAGAGDSDDDADAGDSDEDDTTATSTDSGGCSLAPAGAPSSTEATYLLALGAALIARRRRSNPGPEAMETPR